MAVGRNDRFLEEATHYNAKVLGRRLKFSGDSMVKTQNTGLGKWTLYQPRILVQQLAKRKVLLTNYRLICDAVCIEPRARGHARK